MNYFNNKKQFIHNIFILFLIIYISGCSATSYKKEMDAFNNATTGAKSVFEELISIEQGAAEKTAFLEHLSQVDKSNIIALKLSDECDAIIDAATRQNPELLKQAEKCRVQYYGQSIPGNDLVSQDVSAPQGIKLLNLITEYSNSLADLAGAEDIASINESTEKLRASVLSLGKELNKTTSSNNISAVADPLTAFVQTIFLNYLNHKRFKALRAAVNEAHIPLASSIDILKEQVSSAYLSAALLNYHELYFKLSKIKLENKQKSVDQAYSIYEEGMILKNLIKTNPVHIFDKMLAAHSAMKESLDDPKKQRDYVFNSIIEFKKSVENVMSSLEKQEY